MCMNMYLRALYGHVHTPTCVFTHVRTRAVSWVCLARRWGLPALDTSDRWQLSPATWIQPSPWGDNWQSEAEPTAERGHCLWGQGRSGAGGPGWPENSHRSPASFLEPKVSTLPIW